EGGVAMSVGGRRRLAVWIASCLILGMASAGVGRAAEPLWRESPGAAPPADIARLNDFMNGLAQRLQTSLVHARVRRAADTPPGTEPGATPEERRAPAPGSTIPP